MAGVGADGGASVDGPKFEWKTLSASRARFVHELLANSQNGSLVTSG